MNMGFVEKAKEALGMKAQEISIFKEVYGIEYMRNRCRAYENAQINLVKGQYFLYNGHTKPLAENLKSVELLVKEKSGKRGLILKYDGGSVLFLDLQKECDRFGNEDVENRAAEVKLQLEQTIILENVGSSLPDYLKKIPAIA
jgi:hypothetical protein